MQSGSVDPTQRTRAVSPVDNVHVDAVTTGVVAPIGGQKTTGEHPLPRVEDGDRMEVHVDGVARRAYAQFMAHPETGQVSIKIIDADTQQIIREIPSEEVIHLAEQLQSYWEARTQKAERQ